VLRFTDRTILWSRPQTDRYWRLEVTNMAGGDLLLVSPPDARLDAAFAIRRPSWFCSCVLSMIPIAP
jgi:hypothetical protein